MTSNITLRLMGHGRCYLTYHAAESDWYANKVFATANGELWNIDKCRSYKGHVQVYLYYGELIPL